MNLSPKSTCMCSEVGGQMSPAPSRSEPSALIDEATLARVVEFHGHLCPGLSMGIQVAGIALREIGPHSKDEEVVAVVETDMCGVDAIQFLTGCTFGKGNLLHRDWGKGGYSFFRRSDGKAIRISARHGAWERDPDHQALFAKVRAGEATEEERVRFRQAHEEQSMRVLAKKSDDLFSVTRLDTEPPRRARIHTSIVCSRCREDTMETRVRKFAGDELCLPCFEKALARL